MKGALQFLVKNVTTEPEKFKFDILVTGSVLHVPSDKIQFENLKSFLLVQNVLSEQIKAGIANCEREQWPREWNSTTESLQ